MNNLHIEKLEFETNKDLSEFSGIRVGGKSAYFYCLEEIIDVPKLARFAKGNDLNAVPLGKGTNCFFGSGKLNLIIYQNNLLGKKIVAETDDYVDLEISSGEVWDEIVQWSVENGLSGIEALSAIPGSVGAAPVQNIGAYGQEISNVLLKVEVYDFIEQRYLVFNNEDCDFSYRNSIFKNNLGRYFITKVYLKLRKESHPNIPEYETLKDFLVKSDMSNPSAQDIRNAVMEIRWSKLPRPEVLPNCGSWFKNPIISSKEFKSIHQNFTDIKFWEVNNDRVKLSAGWLVDNSVGKDFDNDYFATYGKNALVIVNHSLTSSPKKLLKFESIIINKVRAKFGVTLEREPQMVT